MTRYKAWESKLYDWEPRYGLGTRYVIDNRTYVVVKMAGVPHAGSSLLTVGVPCRDTKKKK